jgi:hypothetical protein
MNKSKVKPLNCAKCKGECCKYAPGIVVPADIIKKYGKINCGIVYYLLKSKLWAIDWWEAKKPLYYIRPAREGVDGVFDPAWYGGKCVFLTNKGCSAPFKPQQCIDLKPGIDECKCQYGKKYYAEKWLNYRTGLYYTGKAIEKGFEIDYNNAFIQIAKSWWRF